MVIIIIIVIAITHQLERLAWLSGRARRGEARAGSASRLATGFDGRRLHAHFAAAAAAKFADQIAWADGALARARSRQARKARQDCLRDSQRAQPAARSAGSHEGHGAAQLASALIVLAKRKPAS